MPDLKERYLKAKRALFDRAYESLNPEQRRAVFTVGGPLLILAGAGSGKTTVLVKRIAYIIKYGNAYFSDYTPYGLTEEKCASLEAAASLTLPEIEEILPEFISNACSPYRMLAITFTNKAAGEIKARLVKELGDDTIAKDIWSGTFHSVCMRILRAYGERVGYPGAFSIYDTDDQKKTVSAAMKRLNIDEKQFPVKSVMTDISHAKDKLMTPEMFATQAGSDFRLSKVAQIYASYQNALRECNAMDFDDIIMQTVILLRDHEDVRLKYQERFKYVCVDEYQDTNIAQFQLTAMLSDGSKNLMVVGDDDQSIYRFRGATIENILSFDKHYPNATVIKLEQNYRSTQIILSAANAVIANNQERKGKSLWTSKGDGSKIILHELDDQNAEARFVVETVNRMVVKEGRHFRDFAVLYRANAQSNSIERAFAKSATPYRMLGGQRFSDRKEIRDAVAYLQLICNHADRERLLRIINEPRRKIGDKTLDTIGQLAIENDCTYFEIIAHADRYLALARTASTLLDFAKLIEELTEKSTDTPLDAFFDEVMSRSGYRKMLEEGGMEEIDRIENLSEFKSAIVEYMGSVEEPTLAGFLEENALVADVDRYDETADAVVMMTIHSAKGLEFPIVFLPGMEDGIFPSSQTVCAGEAEMEEERRLAYVAITRAKEQLFILHAKTRILYGSTTFNPVSRFVEEIPTELMEEPAASVVERQRMQKPRSNLNNRPKFSDEKITVGKPLFRPEPPMAGNRAVFAAGDHVHHNIFGDGEILSVKSVGPDMLYEIAFETVGMKKLMASYVKLTKIE